MVQDDYRGLCRARELVMHRLLAVLVTLFQVARSDAFQHTLARTRCTHVRRFNRIHGGGGGGGGSGGGISDTSGGEPQPVFRSWVLLASTYSAIIAAKTTLPVTLESLLRSGAAGSGFERLPYRSTMAIIVGKLVLGPITNMMGPFRFLAAVLMCMGACCALCGASTGGGFFSLAWCLLNFAFGGAWGGITAAIREGAPDSWGDQLASCGLASRLSVVLAAATFGRILAHGHIHGYEAWRRVFFVATALTVAPIPGLLRWNRAFSAQPPPIRDKINDEGGSDEPLRAALHRFSHSRTFWALLSARAFHMVVSSFVGFCPIFLGTAFFTTLTSGSAIASNDGGMLGRLSGQMAAGGAIAWAAGGILATSVGAAAYGRASNRGKEAIVGGIGVATVSSSLLLLAHSSRALFGFSSWLLGDTGIDPMKALGLLFILGGGNALPFYVTCNVLSLSLAGKRHTATLANILDAAGFGITIMFEYIAGQCGANAVAKASRTAVSTATARAASACWLPAMQALVLCVTLGAISLNVAMRSDSTEKR